MTVNFDLSVFLPQIRSGSVAKIVVNYMQEDLHVCKSEVATAAIYPGNVRKIRAYIGVIMLFCELLQHNAVLRSRI